MLWLPMMCSAWAGTLDVRSAGPSTVRLGDETLAQTWGPANYAIPDIDAGSYTFRVTHGGKTDSVTVEIPSSGKGVLDITDTVAAPSVSDDPSTPNPTLSVRSSDGKTYALLIDGNRWGTFSPKRTVRVDGLAAGKHPVEIRSQDLTVVWAKGTMDLLSDDAITMSMAEGKSATIEGRPEAWQP